MYGSPCQGAQGWPLTPWVTAWWCPVRVNHERAVINSAFPGVLGTGERRGLVSHIWNPSKSLCCHFIWRTCSVHGLCGICIPHIFFFLRSESSASQSASQLVVGHLNAAGLEFSQWWLLESTPNPCVGAGCRQSPDRSTRWLSDQTLSCDTSVGWEWYWLECSLGHRLVTRVLGASFSSPGKWRQQFSSWVPSEVIFGQILLSPKSCENVSYWGGLNCLPEQKAFGVPMHLFTFLKISLLKQCHSEMCVCVFVER